MTKAERREKLISFLWTKVGENPFALVAIHHLQEQREHCKGWYYEDDLPDGYDHAGRFNESKIVDGVRMFPK